MEKDERKEEIESMMDGERIKDEEREEEERIMDENGEKE